MSEDSSFRASRVAQLARESLEDMETGKFRTVRRGYEQRLVDIRLRDAAHSIRRLLDVLDDLTARVAELEATPPEELDAKQLTAALGGEAVRVLDAARSAAAERIERAEVERTAILEDARVAANEIIQEGRTQGRQAVVEAREVRERILSDLARKRRAHRVEVEQVRAIRDRMLESLSSCQQRLDGLVVAMIEAVPQAVAAAERAGLRIESEPESTASKIEAEIEAARLAGLGMPPQSGRPASSAVQAARAAQSLRPGAREPDALTAATSVEASDDAGGGEGAGDGEIGEGGDRDACDGDHAVAVASATDVGAHDASPEGDDTPDESSAGLPVPSSPATATAAAQSIDVGTPTDLGGGSSASEGRVGVYDVEDEASVVLHFADDSSVEKIESLADQLDLVANDSEDPRSRVGPRSAVSAGGVGTERSGGSGGAAGADAGDAVAIVEAPSVPVGASDSADIADSQDSQGVPEDSDIAGPEPSSVKSNVEDIFARLRSITGKFSSGSSEAEPEASAPDSADPGSEAHEPSSDMPAPATSASSAGKPDSGISGEPEADADGAAPPGHAAAVVATAPNKGEAPTDGGVGPESPPDAASAAGEIAVTQITRALRRVIMDDQNELLDAIRRIGRRAVTMRANVDDSVYTGVLRRPLQQFVSDIDVSIDDLNLKAAAMAIVTTLVYPVRVRLRELAEDTGNAEELSSTVRAIYRESRSRRAPLAAEAAFAAAWPDLDTRHPA